MISSILSALAWLAAYVRAAKGLRRYGIAFLVGVLSILAFAPFHISPILFLTLPVVFWLSWPSADASSKDDVADLGLTIRARLSRAIVWRGFGVGWWFGFGFHLAGLYWIGGAFLVQAEVFAWLLPFAVTLMPAGLAVFHGVAVAAASSFSGGVTGRIVLMALALSATEWLRGNIFTGFPWNTLGYALCEPIVLMQSAGVLGIYGLTLLTVLIFTTPLVLAARISNDRRWRPVALPAACLCIGPLLVMTAYGALVLAQPSPPDVPSVKLRLVQPSIKQRDKFDPSKRREIFERHLALSKAGPSGRDTNLDGITHIIWPEAALAFLALRSPKVLEAIAKTFPDDIRLIAGTLRLDGELVQDGRKLKVFNSAMVVGGDGVIFDTYDKVHLVPFGEYLPFQGFLEAIGLEQLTRVRGGFAAGDWAGRQMQIPGLPATRILICYEVIFPDEVASSGERPALLMNLTNDAWYGPTSGPYQHFHQSVVRAVELGLPLIRVGNNGISGVIDARGRVLSMMDLDEAGAIDTPLPGALSETLYSSLGDGIFWLIWVLLGGVTTIWSCMRPFKA